MNEDKYAPFNPWRSPHPWNQKVFTFEHIEPVEENMVNSFACELTRYLDGSLLLEDSPLEWWTPYEDMLLVRGVVRIGWPNDKGRYDSLRKFLIRQDNFGYLARGPLEVSPEFFEDVVYGGKGFSTHPVALTRLSEKELLPPNVKPELMRRLKEIIYVLENTNPTVMSLNQRNKPTFSNSLIKMLGRYGKPLDLPSTPVDAFSPYELTTAQLAARTSGKIVRRSEIVKIIAAVESYSLSMYHDPSVDCSHAVS
jgi:hypothetical protein